MTIQKLTKLTKEEFIRRSNLIHNFKYSYEKVNYINNKAKVIITCPEHGDFEQVPKSHYLNGNGCQLCYGNQRKTLSCFIEKSREKHQDKYIYTKVKYINNLIKVIITCPKHGDFDQVPKSHLNGFGCKKCSGLETLTTEQFIEKSNIKHKFKYCYDKSIYINNQTPVEIRCNKHGYFKQIPPNHYLKGFGCKKCKIESMFNSKEDFIEKSNIIHKDKYSYELVEYKRNDEKVEILCRIHGLFLQTPHVHLNGRGCSKCKNSKGEKLIESILNENHVDYKTQVKFEKLKYINDLRVDFGIYVENHLKCLIEYNGKQHYEPIKYFHLSEKSFTESQIRDNLKIEFCDRNKIKLYIIKYDENIEKKIKEILHEEIQYSNKL
jgi:hypothetical protein